MEDIIEHKKAAIIESIRHNIKSLTLIVLLIIFTLLFVNVRILFTLQNYLPSYSVPILMFIMTGLVLIGFYISRRISLNAMNNLVEEITKREMAEENLMKVNEELERKVKERTVYLSKTVKVLKEKIAERKKIEEKLYAMSLTDELTGLHNRRGFFTLAEHRLKIAKREKCGLLLLYADLDNLKEINDTFGHEEGDRLLKNTADILKSTYRESDIIVRIGGDEFVVFPVGTTKDHVEIIISRLQKNIENFNAKRDQRNKLSLSVGISAYDPESVTTVDGLLAEADRLMYEHKIRKKGQG